MKEQRKLCRVLAGRGAENELQGLAAEYGGACRVFDRRVPQAPEGLQAGESDVTLARFRRFCAESEAAAGVAPVLVSCLFEFVDEASDASLLSMLADLCRLAAGEVVIADPCRCYRALDLEAALRASGVAVRIVEM